MMSHFKTEADMLEHYQQQEKRRGELMKPLMANGMNFLTAIVVAGDLLSAEHADKMVAEGIPAEEAVNFIGSYARFDWALKNVPKEKLLAILPDLWVGADPDDTKPEYLMLWKEAFMANGAEIVIDEKPLPKRKSFKIYRGQVGDAKGISWTLDRSIAVKFAATGGGRGEVSGGKILEKTVTRKQILAYLTSRGESEVILNIDAEN